MGKLLQINPVIRESTSTGRIMREIAEMAMAAGWESYIAYGKGRDGLRPSTSHTIPVGNRPDSALHLLLTRIFDMHGLASRRATRRFVREIERIDPDIIHIHNIHGYFLNYKIFFDYLARSGKRVIWTVHDCWLFTGHCYHYTAAGCGRWQTGCHDCPQKGAFPKSLLFDRSRKNYRDRRAAFTSVPGMTIVTVSEWMRGEMSHSFLKGCRFKVINNGIDTTLFSPAAKFPDIGGLDALRGKTIILGVASIWLKEKGLGDFAALAAMCRDDERILLIGQMDATLRAALPDTVITLPRTENAAQLAALYTFATVLVNPTWQDNYPTVNMEAIACGTPVITYRTGGSPEMIGAGTGYVAECGDIAAIRSGIDAIRASDREELRRICRNYALAHFKKENNYKDYLSLYEESAG